MEQHLKQYYGKVLQRSSDLKTNACCTFAKPAPWLSKLLENVPVEVRERYFGCGFVAPTCVEGLAVLDLGCGAGETSLCLHKWSVTMDACRAST